MCRTGDQRTTVKSMKCWNNGKRLLDKRKRPCVDPRTHLLELKAELEQIVTRHEQAVEAEKKRRQAAQAKAQAKPKRLRRRPKPLRLST